MRRLSPRHYQLRISPNPWSRTKKRRKSTKSRKLPMWRSRSRRAVRGTLAVAVAGGGGAVTKKNLPRSPRRRQRKLATKQRRRKPISSVRTVEAKARKLTARRRVMPSGGAGGVGGEAADGAYGGKTAWNPVSKSRARRSIPSRFCRLSR